MRADEAPIESPCEEDLDRMRLEPGGHDRFCDRCEKSVHDLSAMGPERARAFLAANTGPICISYVSDRRGELVFDPPPSPARPKSNFVPLARLAQAATLAASLAACTPHGKDPPEPQVLDVQVEEPCIAPIDPVEPLDRARVLGGLAPDPGARQKLLEDQRQLEMPMESKRKAGGPTGTPRPALIDTASSG